MAPPVIKRWSQQSRNCFSCYLQLENRASHVGGRRSDSLLMKNHHHNRKPHWPTSEELSTIVHGTLKSDRQNIKITFRLAISGPENNGCCHGGEGEKKHDSLANTRSNTQSSRSIFTEQPLINNQTPEEFHSVSVLRERLSLFTVWNMSTRLGSAC